MFGADWSWHVAPASERFHEEEVPSNTSRSIQCCAKRHFPCAWLQQVVVTSVLIHLRTDTRHKVLIARNLPSTNGMSPSQPTLDELGSGGAHAGLG